MQELPFGGFSFSFLINSSAEQTERIVCEPFTFQKDRLTDGRLF